MNPNADEVCTGCPFDLPDGHKIKDHPLLADTPKPRRGQRVIVEVRGGMVQAVYADVGVEVVVIDWDNYGPSEDTLMTVLDGENLAASVWWEDILAEESLPPSTKAILDEWEKKA